MVSNVGVGKICVRGVRCQWLLEVVQSRMRLF